MINAWHLIWIVPMSASFGLGLMAVLQAGARYDTTIPDAPVTARATPKE